LSTIRGPVPVKIDNISQDFDIINIVVVVIVAVVVLLVLVVEVVAAVMHTCYGHIDYRYLDKH
jgi:hypothetical protein